jgi:hypothetical protein
VRVNRFGVHWAPGRVAFLLQDTGSQNAIAAGIPCPYDVKKRLPCPHEINLASADVDVIDDPLVQAMSPAPRRPDEPLSYLLHDPDGQLIPVVEALTYMSSPTEVLVGPVWWKTPTEVAGMAALTNVSPVGFTDLTFQNCGRMETLTQALAPSGRRVLFVTRERLFPAVGGVRVETRLSANDLVNVPLREIGATLLRKYMLDG